MSRYDSIINLPHFKDPGGPQMSMHDRAAQFAPFKALTGYEDSINESSRYTESRPELSDAQRNDLDMALSELRYNFENLSSVTAEYFIPDRTKPGGMMKTVTGKIAEYDEPKEQIVFEDGTVITFDDLYFLSVY